MSRSGCLGLILYFLAALMVLVPLGPQSSWFFLPLLSFLFWLILFMLVRKKLILYYLVAVFVLTAFTAMTNYSLLPLVLGLWLPIVSILLPLSSPYSSLGLITALIIGLATGLISLVVQQIRLRGPDIGMRKIVIASFGLLCFVGTFGFLTRIQAEAIYWNYMDNIAHITPWVAGGPANEEIAAIGANKNAIITELWMRQVLPPPLRKGCLRGEPTICELAKTADSWYASWSREREFCWPEEEGGLCSVSDTLDINSEWWINGLGIPLSDFSFFGSQLESVEHPVVTIDDATRSSDRAKRLGPEYLLIVGMSLLTALTSVGFISHYYTSGQAMTRVIGRLVDW